MQKSRPDAKKPLTSAASRTLISDLQRADSLLFNHNGVCDRGGVAERRKQRAGVQSLSEAVADARTKRHRTPEEIITAPDRVTICVGHNPHVPGEPAVAETLSNSCVAIIKNYGRARR